MATKIATVASVTYLLKIRAQSLLQVYSVLLYKLVFRKERSVYKLCFGIKDICGPAAGKTWISCEPQKNQQNEKTQDTYFSKRHGAKQTMLLPDYIVGSNFLFCLCSPTTPCLPKAKGITKESRGIHITPTFNCNIDTIKNEKKNYMLNRVFQILISFKPSSNSLESHEDKLQPKPGHCEHKDHIWEGKAKPGGKVNHIAVFRKQSNEKRQNNHKNNCNNVPNIGALLPK